jgi:UDP-2,3-diacylglucosamine pyrophosphatase LpxH
MNHEEIIRALQYFSANHETPWAKIQLLHEPIPLDAVFFCDEHIGAREFKAKKALRFLKHIAPKNIFLDGDFLDGHSLGIARMHDIGRIYCASTKQKREEIHALFRHAGRLVSTNAKKEEMFAVLHHMDRLIFAKPEKDEMRLLPEHLDVLSAFWSKASKKGADTFYIPGNHDAFLRPNLSTLPDLPEGVVDQCIAYDAAAKALAKKQMGKLFGPYGEAFLRLQEIKSRGRVVCLPYVTYKTPDDKRLLVKHGDEFDMLIKHARFLEILGTKTRDNLFMLSEWLSQNDKHWIVRGIMRNMLGLGSDFSLAEQVHNFKTKADVDLPRVAIESVDAHNEITLRKRKTDPAWANQPLLDGIVVGHNHTPAAYEENGKIYGNGGDWLSNCTAYVVHPDGRRELVMWDDDKGVIPHPCPDPRKAPLMKAEAA